MAAALLAWVAVAIDVGAAPPPAPEYRINNLTLSPNIIGAVPPPFADPSDAADWINAQYSAHPFHESSLGVTLYCPASATRLAPNDFRERVPLSGASQYTGTRSVATSTPECSVYSGVCPNCNCQAVTCGPLGAGQVYEMIAGCPGEGLLFHEGPARCECGPGTVFAREVGRCVPAVETIRDRAPAACGVQAGSMPGFGNPIYPLIGTKQQKVDLGHWSGQRLTLTYDSRRRLPSSDPTTPFFATPAPSFGALWESSLHRRLVPQGFTSAIGGFAGVRASRGDGEWVGFTRDASGGTYTADAGSDDRLLGGGSSNWIYIDATRRAEEVYDAGGRLLRIHHADGRTWTYAYTTGATPQVGLVEAVTDAVGRSVRFDYEPGNLASDAPRVVAMTIGDQVTRFGYDVNGNLDRVTWPDAAASTRRLLYEDPRHPWALTGLVDESQTRITTYAYDDAGRAVATQAAGDVARYAVEWTAPPQWLVAERYDAAAGVMRIERSWVTPPTSTLSLPNGQATALGAAEVQGVPLLVTQAQPAGSGCGPSSSSREYDARGNVVRIDDFNGHRMCLGYDGTRNVETMRVEGLPSTALCADFGAGAIPALPAGSRRISTRWHPDWRLPVQVAEPGRITSFIYHGQRDDTLPGSPVVLCPGQIGGATAILPTLPSGRPLALLCKKQVLATTDADGRSGLAAAIDTSVPQRTWTYTYNARGQMLTEVGPRTDVVSRTSYTYYADTGFSGTAPNLQGHTAGDLASVTNAANQATRYTKYDKAGLLLESVDANLVTTTRTYDARSNLITSTVGTETTTYEYDVNGLLKKVTQPDGASFIAYTYDAAQRLTGLSDNLGNTISYALDGFGNVAAESILDPNGILRRTVQRERDALGRVQRLIGRE